MNNIEDRIPAEVYDVGISETAKGIAPLMVLKRRNEKEYLFIYVGLAEAISANIGLKGEDTSRPSSHDLILNFLNKVDVEIKHIIVDDLENGIYFAQLVLKSNQGINKIDARPSDCIAIATRRDIDIYVKKNILDKVSKTEKDVEKIKPIEDYLDKT